MNVVTLNWLKQYVDFDGSPEELAERLTMLRSAIKEPPSLGGSLPILFRAGNLRP